MVSVVWSPAAAPLVLFSAIVLALLFRPRGSSRVGTAVTCGADSLGFAARRSSCWRSLLARAASRRRSRCSTSCCSTTILFWIAQATSWNILSGYSGYFSFGQAAFVGVGAYTTAVLTAGTGSTSS